MIQSFDITIVGGGIVGAASFYKIAKKYPHLSVAIVEKESELAAHQTGNNSGVIHSGLYYKPGSSKARNCVEGRHELVKFCQVNNIDHEVCGKVVAAVDEKEMQQVHKIFENGVANGTEGIEKIDGNQVKEIEPYVKAVGGIYVPCTGIVDFVGATKKMVELGLTFNSSNALKLKFEVKDVIKTAKGYEISNGEVTFETKKVIFCGGLQADRLAHKEGLNIKEKVVGFRGDYYELTDQAKHKVKSLIYPVPNPDFPFLGVHFTRMVNGEIECGPNAVFTFKREGYNKTDFDLKDTISALSYSGTWKLFLNNISFGINEYRRAFSKKLFLETLQRLIPSLTMDDIKPARSGVRAMLLNKEGDTRDDFRIEYSQNSIHVLNAPSPAATASLAIGERVCEMAEKHFEINNLK